MQNSHVSESVIQDILNIVHCHQNKDYSQVLTSFEYFGLGAEFYAQLVASDEFTCFNIEKKLLATVVDVLSARFLHRGNRVGVVDLGVGDGLKWNDAFKALTNRVSAHYVGIDMSADMIEMAKTHFCGDNIDYHVGNFMNAAKIKTHLHQDVDWRILSMLGNTICNFIDGVEELHVLKAAQHHDYCPTLVVLGLELFDNNTDSILRAYQNDLSRKIDMIPLGLLGIQDACGIHEIRFNERMSRVEEWYRVTTDVSFTPPFSEIRQELKKDDVILLSVTQKPTEHALVELLSKVWAKADIEIFREEGNAIVVISPHVYVTPDNASE